jgi:hypothetical protein
VSAQQKLYFSSIEFRPKLGELTQSIHLGWLLEFTTPSYWVVGLGMRAVLDPEAVAQLDRLSRELLENRANLFETDLDQALRGAVRPGDVLAALSKANPWSVHITEPNIIPIPRSNVTKSSSIEQALEQYILTVYQRAFAKKTVRSRARTSPRAQRPSMVRHDIEPIETPPPWMLPPRHWARPLLDHH